ncbi:hypothetical protein HPP92_020367 [Vanilla planifolia]|nr:hypothetical protein HPP92_020367 [Vanilla planifolia]
MHSFIDVAAGITIGLVILAFWLVVDEHIDEFLTSGQNVVYFSVNLFFLMLFAYPTPEVPTPSFSYHTAFNGVAFGLVIGIQQTHLLTHSESIPLLFSPELPLLVFVGRIATGIPAILLVKFSSRALAKWLLPVICNTLGIPVRSSCYVPSLKEPNSSNNMPAHKPNTYLQRIALLPHKAYDVDTGIRFLQYAGLAWSSLVLVPYVFYCLNL